MASSFCRARELVGGKLERRISEEEKGPATVLKVKHDKLPWDSRASDV